MVIVETVEVYEVIENSAFHWDEVRIIDGLTGKDFDHENRED